MTGSSIKSTTSWRRSVPPTVRNGDTEKSAAATITCRLENWGTWASEGKRGARAECMTGVIYDRGRRAAGAQLSDAQQQPTINRRDASQVAVAFARLPQAHRELLHWTYVAGMAEVVVAKCCGFPKDEYDARLAAAQAAIELAAGAYMEQRG